MSTRATRDGERDGIDGVGEAEGAGLDGCCAGGFVLFMGCGAWGVRMRRWYAWCILWRGASRRLHRPARPRYLCFFHCYLQQQQAQHRKRTPPHNAYILRQLCVVLLPALQNVVRRLVLECTLDATESSTVAKCTVKMTLAKVVVQLCEEEGVWFDGIDWSVKRRNAREAEVKAWLLRDVQHERARGSTSSTARRLVVRALVLASALEPPTLVAFALLNMNPLRPQ
ncbi:hypothetical protein C8R45DRAFT_1134068 [Mycena sanguinolenta]|nr:hypothetical protein C8R45DRAFT_1134068 [Mycena sanguinolenta]